jgi:uncharacterized membrane protein
VLFVQSRKKIGWSWPKILRHFFNRGFILVLLNMGISLSFTLLNPNIIPVGSGIPLILLVIYALGVNIFLTSLILFAEDYLTTTTLTNHFTQSSLDTIIPLNYAILTLILSIIPTLYTPPSNAQGPYSAFVAAVFLPTTKHVQGVWSIYPFFPWLAPTVFGLAIGRIVTRFKLDAARQSLLCVSLGVVLLALFVPLRYFGVGSINTDLLHRN